MLYFCLLSVGTMFGWFLCVMLYARWDRGIYIYIIHRATGAQVFGTDNDEQWYICDSKGGIAEYPLGKDYIVKMVSYERRR